MSSKKVPLSACHTLLGQQVRSFCLDFGFTFLQHTVECAFEIVRKELVQETLRCVLQEESGIICLSEFVVPCLSSPIISLPALL